MQPIKYETWIKLKKWLEAGADVAAPGAAVLFAEIPIIGPLLGEGLIRVLEWSFGQLLDYLPHENEPRGDTTPWAPLHAPGFKYFVASPNMYGGDAERARAASLQAQLNQPVSMGDPAKIEEALKTIREFKEKTGITNLTDLSQKNPLFKTDKKEVVPVANLTPGSTEIWNKYYRDELVKPKIGITLETGPKYYDPKKWHIIDRKRFNPTMGVAGFA